MTEKLAELFDYAKDTVKTALLSLPNGHYESSTESQTPPKESYVFDDSEMGVLLPDYPVSSV